MARTTVIELAEELPVVIDMIHDSWFNANAISYDKESRTLSIPFARESENREIVWRWWFLKRVKRFYTECLLRIHHVDSYVVEDEAQVGTYDFNEIEYNAGLKEIRITTGVPIEMRMTVQQLKISVEESEKVIEEKTRFSI